MGRAAGGDALTVWQLPESVELGGKTYGFYPDFRVILKIFRYWNDPELPEFLKWQVGLRLFYAEPVARRDVPEAMEYLAGFVAGFQPQKTFGGRLLDWQHDANLIVADINKVAGREIRELPFVHWWTFLSWFHGIGPGQLSTVVSIRDKLRKGQKLESWEAEFYRENPGLVKLPPRLTREEMQQRSRLESLLSGEEVDPWQQKNKS